MKVFTPILAIALLVGGGGVAMIRHHDARVAAERKHADAARRVAADHRALEAGIRDYEAARSRDTMSAVVPARLASLYLQRARVTGDYGDQLRAEAAARQSLALRVQRNGDAAASLVSALLGQHRFREAAEYARALAEHEPDVPAYRAMLGEILLELGDYAGARASFSAIARDLTRPSVAPRYARFLELTGSASRARAVMRAAGEDALARDDLSREQLAWYYLRMGDLEQRSGRYRGAERAYREGLEVAPGDHRLLAALARFEANRHQWHAALDAGDAALAVTIDPAVLITLRQAAAAIGDSVRAADYDAALDVAFLQQQGPFHRAVSLDLIDRGRHVDLVMKKLHEEMLTRRDVYAWDLLGWALYHTGDVSGAAAAARAALSQQTEDALILFHAGAIERAAGDTARARQHLSRALALNPRFDPQHPAHARALLDSLVRGSAR